MTYLDSTYSKVCTMLLNVARAGGADHASDGYLKRAEDAYKVLKETNPSLAQLREIAKSIGYDDSDYDLLVANCSKQ